MRAQLPSGPAGGLFGIAWMSAQGLALLTSQVLRTFRNFIRPPDKHARSSSDNSVSDACLKGFLGCRINCYRLPRHEGSWAGPQVGPSSEMSGALG